MIQLPNIQEQTQKYKANHVVLAMKGNFYDILLLATKRFIFPEYEVYNFWDAKEGHLYNFSQPCTFYRAYPYLETPQALPRACFDLTNTYGTFLS